MISNVKKFLIIFIILVLININGIITYASSTGIGEIVKNEPEMRIAVGGGSWLKKEDITHSFSDKSTASDTATNTLTTMTVVIKVVGVSIAIVMLITLGMKYMLSAPGEKGEIKKHAVVYIIGAVVLFGAVGLLNILEDFASSINVTIK